MKMDPLTAWKDGRILLIASTNSLARAEKL